MKKFYSEILVVLLITFLVFVPSLKNDFTNWDDNVHVTGNGLIKSLDFAHIEAIFTTVVNCTYIPLTILSFAFEYCFFGLNPFIYHLDSLLLHLAVTALVFMFAMRLGAPRRAAAIAALVFGIHPMHVESVAWVTARKDVLYGFFYMLALVSYQRYLREKTLKNYALVFFSGLLSILAKPMALSLPLVLLLCDWFYGRREHKGALILEKMPILAYSAVIACVTWALNPKFAVVDPDPVKAVLIYVWSLTFYLYKFFCPIFFVPHYSIPEPVVLWNVRIAMGVIVLILSIWYIICHRKDRWVIFAGVYYFVSIFYVLRLTDTIPKGNVADRYMYMASVGFCILLGVMADHLQERFERKGIFYRWVGYACFIVLVGFLCTKTIEQSKIWKDSVTFWTYVIEHTPSQDFIYNNRGTAYAQIGQYELSIKDLNKALAINPELKNAYVKRGEDYYNLGQYPSAMEDFNRALKIDPSYAIAYNSRGALYRFQNRYDLALADYNKALTLDPFLDEAYNNRGVIYMIKGSGDLAMSDFNRALSLQPDFADAYANRGLIYRLKEQYNLALENYNRALAIRPDKNSFINRGLVYSALAQYDAAIADLSTAIRLDPGNYEIYEDRAMVFVNLEQCDLVVRDLTRVIAFKPDHARAYYIRSICYDNIGQSREARNDLLKARSLGYHVPAEYSQKFEGIGQK